MCPPDEHLGSIVKRKVVEHKSKSKPKLEVAIRSIWTSISENTCKKLVLDMSKRINAVLKAHGGVTKINALVISMS